MTHGLDALLPPRGRDTVAGHTAGWGLRLAGETGVSEALKEYRRWGLSVSFLLRPRRVRSWLPSPSPFLSCPLPAVAGVAHRFHSTCGKNITLEEDGTRAVRAAGYAHGLVFSTKELKTEEVFEVGSGDVAEAAADRASGAKRPPTPLPPRAQLSASLRPR